MGNNAIFGRYWATDSPLHRLDPRTKLLVTIVLVVITFCAGDFCALGFVALLVVGLFAVARIPLGQALLSIAPLVARTIQAVYGNSSVSLIFD